MRCDFSLDLFYLYFFWEGQHKNKNKLNSVRWFLTLSELFGFYFIFFSFLIYECKIKKIEFNNYNQWTSYSIYKLKSSKTLLLLKCQTYTIFTIKEDY